MDLPVLNGDASASLERARAAALERGQDQPDLADILIGVVEGASVPAHRVFELFELEAPKVARAVRFIGHSTSWYRDPDAERRTVELARTEAATLGHDETGSEHLLLALMGQNGTLAAGLLESLGMTLDAAREAVRFVHGQVATWERPESSSPSEHVSWAPMEAVPYDISPEHGAQLLEMAMAHVDVGSSKLDRVVGIGQIAEAAGIVVEMIALEIRQVGAVLHWRTSTAEERFLGSADMTIDDDVGTRYRLLPASWSGSGRESRGQTDLVPVPPTDARTLIIEVHSFGHSDWPSFGMRDETRPKEASGSWRFEVPLGG